MILCHFAAMQTKPFKLRIYVKSSIHKGYLKRQEYFSNLNDLDHRYKELGPNKFVDYALNPTAWQLVNGEWLRILGY